MFPRLQDVDPNAPLPARMRVFFATANSAAEMNLMGMMHSLGLPCHSPFPNVITGVVRRDQLRMLIEHAERLPADIRQATRCRLDANDLPTPAELMFSASLDELVAWGNSLWLRSVLAEGRLQTHFQPIVSAADPNQVFAYECLVRGLDEDGSLISPDRLFDAARASSLLQALDEAARLHAIRSAAEHEISCQLFINVNPTALTDPIACIGATLREAVENQFDLASIVFEIVESEQVTQVEELLEILEFCRSAGCRVALDDIGAGYSSLNLLTKLRPDFVKLDYELVKGVEQDSYKGCVVSKLIELARELGVTTVVEGVETEEQCEMARGFHADLLQGYLFAKPRAVPPVGPFLGPAAVSESRRPQEPAC